MRATHFFTGINHEVIDIEPFTTWQDRDQRKFVIIDLYDDEYPHKEIFKEGERFEGGTVVLFNVDTEEIIHTALTEFKRFLKEGLMARHTHALKLKVA